MQSSSLFVYSSFWDCGQLNAAKEKTAHENWQDMEMKNNAAYISTTNNMQMEDNIVYVAYDHSWDQIPTKDNTAYVSTHLQVPEHFILM